MATAENTPVREIPGLTGEGLRRTKARLRGLGRKASEVTGLTKLFGTPESPTKLGRVMDFVGSVAESAPATGMIIRNPAALNPKMVAKANQMLRGRMWSDLARDERLAIKKATGLEQVEGGLPGWATESATDPVLKTRKLERAAEWQRGDHASGEGMGTYRDIVTGGEGYVRSLDEGSFAWVQMRKARYGEQGSFDPYNETLYLSENAKLSGTGSTVVHEGQHMSQDLARQAIREKDVPYGYKPSEIEARIAEHRAELTPEQRSNSLLEESQNNWGEKWYHEEMKIEQQKLRQAAKGGSNDRSRMANFLATDKVPDTIFGIPVVSRRDSYSEKDIAFFKEHPEAGGYYDMGSDDAEPEQGALGGGVAMIASVLLPEGAKRAGFGDKIGALATRHGRTTQAGLEVDDPEPSTDDITMPEGAEGTLGVLLNFDEGPGAVIKKAYPNISEVPVLFARMDRGNMTGGYDPPSERFPHGRIVIAPGLSHSEVYGNLLHEMTHYVQGQEPGSHLGSTPERAGGYLKYKGKIGELVAQTVELRSAANPFGRVLKDLPFHKALEKVREYNRLMNQKHVSGKDVYSVLKRRPQEPERVIEIAK